MRNFLKHEGVRYLISGGSAVFTDFLIYFLLFKMLLISPSVSKGISYISGAIVAYLINRLWTFEGGKSHSVSRSFAKFSILYLTTFCFNIIVNKVVLNIFGWAILGFMAATFVTIVCNYLGQKFWVFKKTV